MTYPPPPGPDGVRPPPPDPPIQAYQPPPPPYPQQYGYQPPPPVQGYGVQPPPSYDYGNPGSPYSQPAYPYAPARPTEGLAIASLVVSCAGVLGLCAWGIGGALGIVGAILGHLARRKIQQTGAAGAGLALAGIIVGWVCTAIGVVGGLFLVSVLFTSPDITY